MHVARSQNRLRRVGLAALTLALATAALAPAAAAQGVCTVRNGSGTNPVGFACASEPVVGKLWNSTVDIIGPGANFSALQIFVGGPLAGIPLGTMGELLCSPPFLPFDLSTGVHSIFIPGDPNLVGKSVCVQAATLTVAIPEIKLQNAIDITFGTDASADITVLVLLDSSDLSVPPTQVSGATVILQGTDPASMAGLTGTTGAGGTVTFNGVSGPYTVTAQADLAIGGGTLRTASSLIDVVPTVTVIPPAATIGVLLSAEQDSPPENAFLSGTVSNLPALAGNEFLRVVAVGNGGVDFEASSFVDPFTGAYSMSIPSNTPIDCFVAHFEDFSLVSSPVIASLLAPGVGQTGPGTTLTANFNFGSPAVVPWTKVVSFTATNVNPALDLSIQVLAEDQVNGVEFDFSFYDGNPPPPGSLITLPDPGHPALSAYKLTLDADSFDPFGNVEAGQACSEVLTTTISSFAFDFFSLPVVVQPPNLSVHTQAAWANLTVQFVESNTGSFGSNGFNQWVIFAEDGVGGPLPPGIDASLWLFFVRPGQASFDIPPTSLPMFGLTQDLFWEMEQVRFAGTTVDFDTVFDGNLAANLAALLGSFTEVCDSSIAFETFLVP